MHFSLYTKAPLLASGLIQTWDSTPAKVFQSGSGAFSIGDWQIYAGTATGIIRAQSILPATGKQYYELNVTRSDAVLAGRLYAGTHNTAPGTWPGTPAGTYITFQSGGGAARLYVNSVDQGSVGSAGFSSGTFGQAILGIAVDADTRKIWFKLAGAWLGGGDPATNTGGYTATGVNDIFIYGDIDITSATTRTVEIIQVSSHTFAPPSGFTPVGS